jgi:hypothetical protein
VTQQIDFGSFAPVSVPSMKFVDVGDTENQAKVELFDKNGLAVVTVTVPPAENNGLVKFSLPPNEGIFKMVVTFHGSGAIDDIHFVCPESTTTTVAPDDDHNRRRHHDDRRRWHHDDGWRWHHDDGWRRHDDYRRRWHHDDSWRRYHDDGWRRHDDYRRRWHHDDGWWRHDDDSWWRHDDHDRRRDDDDGGRRYDHAAGHLRRRNPQPRRRVRQRRAELRHHGGCVPDELQASVLW